MKSRFLSPLSRLSRFSTRCAAGMPQSFRSLWKLPIVSFLLILCVAPPLWANGVTGPASVDFGSMTVGAAAISQSVTFSVAAGTTIGSVQVLTEGAPGLDFRESTSPSPCANATTTCNTTIKFVASAPGLRRGAIVLSDGSGNLLFSVLLSGTGNGAMAAFSPGAGSVVPVGNLTDQPSKVVLDGAGNMYVASYAGSSVVKVLPTGGSATVVASAGLTTVAGLPLGHVGGIALDGAGNLFIADYTNSRIIKLQAPVTSSSAASVVPLPLLNPALYHPTDVALDSVGGLSIADCGDPTTCPGRLVLVDALSGLTYSISPEIYDTDTSTWVPYQFLPSGLASIAWNPSGSLYVLDRFGSKSGSGVFKTAIVAPDGVGKMTQLSTGTLVLNGAQGMSLDGSGNVYIADTGNRRVVMVTSAGTASVVPMLGLPAPTALSAVSSAVANPQGALYLLDSGTTSSSAYNRIVHLNVASASLAFASGVINTISVDSPRILTVTNIGNQPLTFDPDPSIAAADFAINGGDSSGCDESRPVGAGLTCDLSVNFTPKSVGTITGTASLVDNAVNALSPQSVALSGTGVSVSDTTVTALTASPSLTVTETQTLTLTATVTDTAAGHSATLPTGNVSFVDIVGTKTVYLNGGNPIQLSSGVATLSVVLSGTGPHTIRALYGGINGSFEPSSSNSVALTVYHGIKFPNPGAQSYGATVALTATSSGNLQILYQVTSGPATINGSLLTVTGVGTIAVSATEITPANGSNPLPAPAQSISFAANPAPLTVLAANQSKVYDGGAFPTASFSVSYSGFVNGEGAAVLGGSLIFSGNGVGATGAGTYTITPAGLTATNYALTFSNGTLTISKVPMTVIANGASMTYGTALPIFSGTLSGPLPGDNITASYATAAAITSNVGTYAITPVLHDPNTKLGNYAVTSTNGVLAIGKAGSTAAIQAGAPAVLYKSNATFTARLTSATTGTPTGTVDFRDGTADLGSATLDSTGAATLTIASLALGSHSITAVYGGDINFTGCTTPTAASESVQDFQFTINGTSATDLAQASLSSTVTAGDIASYQFQLAPSSGTSFPNAINLSLTGLPTGASYTITPAALAAGSPAQTVTVQVYTVRPTASLRHSGRGLPSLALGLLIPFFGFVGLRRPGRAAAKRLLLPLLLVLVIGMTGVVGCGGGNSSSSSNSSTAQSYSLKLNASTSGGLGHFLTLSLTIR